MKKTTKNKDILTPVIIILLLIIAIGGSWLSHERANDLEIRTQDVVDQLGIAPRIITSAQVGSSAAVDFILSTNGLVSTWIANTGGGSSLHATNTNSAVFPLNGLSHESTFYTSTSTEDNTFPNVLITNGSTTNATSTNQAITSLSSALIQAESNGLLTEYTGTTCTNQFVRLLSALGVATCESVGTTDITDGTILEADLNLNAPTDNQLLTASSTAAGGYAWTSTTSPLLGLVQFSDLHDPVTLAGTPDYITISGQVITRNTINIGDDTDLTCGTNCTLTASEISVDDAFLVNDADDTTSGILTVGGIDMGSLGNRIDFDADNDTSIRASLDDTFAFEQLGVDRTVWGLTNYRFNDTSLDMDFIIDGDTIADLFFLNAGLDRIGIGSTTPNSIWSVGGTSTVETLNVNNPDHTGTSTMYIYSGTSGFGGEIILEDSDGAGCTSITTLNEVITGTTVTCPANPVSS